MFVEGIQFFVVSLPNQGIEAVQECAASIPFSHGGVMYEQLTLFQPPAPPARAVYGSGIGQVPALPGRRDSAHRESIYLDRLLPLEEYDKIIILFSGGKDSLACVLDLLKQDGQRLKLPAKSSCSQGRWCSGSLKARVESKLYSDIDTLAQDVKILFSRLPASCRTAAAPVWSSTCGAFARISTAPVS